MSTSIPDGQGYIAGHSREKAQRLLKIAADLHLRGRVIRSTSDGYLVPLAVLDVFAPASAGTPAVPAESDESTAPQDRPEASAPAAETPSSTWTNKQIKAWADEHGIVLDDLRTKAEFLAAIEEQS